MVSKSYHDSWMFLQEKVVRRLPGLPDLLLGKILTTFFILLCIPRPQLTRCVAPREAYRRSEGPGRCKEWERVRIALVPLLHSRPSLLQISSPYAIKRNNPIGPPEHYLREALPVLQLSTSSMHEFRYVCQQLFQFPFPRFGHIHFYLWSIIITIR